MWPKVNILLSVSGYSRPDWLEIDRICRELLSEGMGGASGRVNCEGALRASSKISLSVFATS